MKLSTFIKYFNIWSTFFLHWLMKNLFITSAKKSKLEFYFLISCCIFGAIIGTTLGVLMIHWGYIPNFANEISSANDVTVIFDISLEHLHEQEKTEIINKAEKELRKNAVTHYRVWVLTTIVVYCIVFSFVKLV